MTVSDLIAATPWIAFVIALVVLCIRLFLSSRR